MVGLIAQIMGDYAYQFFIISANFLNFFICTLLYGSRLQRRKMFPLRLALSVILCLACHIVIAIVRTDFNSIYTRIPYSLFSYLLPLPLLILLYDERIHTILLAWCAAVATQDIGGILYSLFLSACGVDDRTAMTVFPTLNQELQWAVYFLCHILLYLLCFWFCGRSAKVEEDDELVRSLIYLSVSSALVLAVLRSLTSEFRGESRPLYQIIQGFSVVYAVFILVQRGALLTQRRHRQELSIMERMLEQGRKQYESVKKNIDVVNMKCHDLKHRLADLEGRLTAQEVADLQEAISIYDNNIKTGNETLDVILYEKQLLAQKDGVLMSCMADGEALSFMSASHLYSLFNNAISNALEAVLKISDPEKRVIGITVRRDGDGAVINITNYFSGSVKIVDGLPVTTKDDRNRHGFGVRSMQYIVEQYNGSLSASTEGELFSLDVRLPYPQ